MMRNNYEEAKEIFLKYDGRYFHMYREGVLSEYEKFNIPREVELNWLKEKIENTLIEIQNTQDIGIKYSKYWEILFIIEDFEKNKIFKKIIEDNEILKKIIEVLEKDFENLDIFSITRILEMSFENKKLWKNYRKRLKKAISFIDISEKEIISKDHNGYSGTQGMTEKEVIERYKNILLKL